MTDDPFAKIVADSQGEADPFAEIVRQSVKQPAKRSYGEETLRQLALTGRSAFEGLTALPALVAEGAIAPTRKLQNVARSFGIPIPEAFAHERIQPMWAKEHLKEKLYGGIKPENSTEGVVGDIISAGTGGAQFAKFAPKTPEVIQALSAALSGGASGYAREQGAGPVGQFVAGIAAPMAPYAAVQGARGIVAVPKKILNIIDAAGLPGGGKRGATQIIGATLAEGRKPSTPEEVRKLAENLDDVIKSIKDSPADWTAPQAVAAKTNNPAFVAIDFIAKNDRPSQYTNAIKKLKGGEQAMLSKMARGRTAEESMAAQQQMRSNLEQALGPRREAELGAAGQAGKTMAELGPRLAQKQQSYISALQNRGVMQTEAAQQGKLAQGERAANSQLIRNLPEGMERNPPIDAFGRPVERNLPAIEQPTGLPAGAYPVPGQPRIPPRYTLNVDRAKELSSATDEMAAIAKQRSTERQFIESKIGSLEAHGLKPLTIDPIVGNIERQLTSKTTQVNEVMSNALKSVADKFRISAGGGTVDPYALYEIRKTGINQVFEELVASGKMNKTQAAAAIKQLRPMIDDAIENAGGDGWRSYITKYHKGLEAIDRVKLLEVARKTYKNNPKAFAELVRGEKPEVVQEFLVGKFKIGEGVTPQRLRQMESIADRIEADVLVDDMTTKGASKLTSILRAKQNPSNVTQGLLLREVTFTNNIFRILEGKGTKKIDAVLSDLMLPENRQALIEVLMKANPSTKGLVLKEMAKKGIKLQPATIGTLLTLESEQSANP